MLVGAQVWSTAKAIALGHATVTVPVLAAVTIPATVGLLLFGGRGGLGGALLGCCLFAWPVWALSVSRWRRRVAGRVAEPSAVQRFAVLTGLIGPPGSVIEQAEKTIRVPVIWGALGAGLAFLAAFVLLVSRASTQLAVAFMAVGSLWIAGAIALDLRRSSSSSARIGVAASVAAAAAWVVLPRTATPAWGSAALLTLTTVFAFCSVALLALIPADPSARRRWTFVGLGIVSVVSLSASFASAASAIQSPKSSPASSVAIASPKVKATWASFQLGADKPHRTLSDGLQIADVVVGSGPAARSGDILTVRYIMWLGDGQQVDSTDAHGSSFTFTLGTGTVIQGWEEGMPGMALGGTRRLVIPPALAYGDRGAVDTSGTYVVPPNTTLVFIIQLLIDSPKR